MKLILKNIFFLSLVFVASFAVWYSPAVFKGHVPYKVSELMPIAKNVYKTGRFSMENDKNVYLASSLIKEKGQTSIVGNKMTAYFYAWVFKFTGLLNPDKLILFSVMLNSMTLIVFAFIVSYLFGLRVSALFSLAYILMPFNWLSVYSVGVYEFATLFMSFFFLFFVLAKEKKPEFIYLFSAGFFLGLAALSRETFFLIIPAIIVYFWLAKKWRSLIPIAISVLIMIVVFYLPTIFGKDGGNVYTNLFSGSQSKTEKFTDFTYFGHLYPDPYVYHQERKEFLDSYKAKTEKAGFIEFLQMKKVMANMGEKSVGIFERLSLGMLLFSTHLANFFSLEIVGGPFILLFAIFGMIYLKRKDIQLYKFFSSWFFVTLFLLSFVVLVSREHLKDFSWFMPLLVSLGAFFLIDLLKEKYNLRGRKLLFLTILVSFVILYGLVVSDHVVFGKIYDKDGARKIETYAVKIREAMIPNDTVIALGLDSKEELLLNYLTDKTTVVITPDTVKKLIDQKKTNDAFEFFGAKYILGYSDDLSAKILAGSKLINIASSSIRVSEDKNSAGRSLLMNLVK